MAEGLEAKRAVAKIEALVEPQLSLQVDSR
jgi:hypothetical protein